MERAAGMAFVAAAAVAVVACGSGTASPTVASNTPRAATVTTPAGATASASPTPAPQMLFAVLEAHGANAKGALRDDTVAIIGLDGVAKAKARFAPQPVPEMGSVTGDPPALVKTLPVLFTEAHVADGGVYYADGKGVIRRLQVGHDPATITSFPLGSAQQELSFAVSPDGTRLMGEIFTLPPKTAPDPCSSNDCYGPSPTFTNVVYQAQVGGTASQVSKTTKQNLYESHTALAGWDSQGPLAATDVPAASNAPYGGGGDLGQALSSIARLRSDGSAGLLLGGSGCTAADESDSGSVACLSGGVEVRSATGVSLYSVGLADLDAGYVTVSPDGNQVAASFETRVGLPTPASITDRCIVQSKDGSTIDLPADFKPEGWLDASTIIGIHGPDSAINGRQGPMGYVRLANPSSVVDLGFSGSYVGLVQAGV